MGYDFRGAFSHILALKLKALTKDLKIQNKKVFGNVFRKVRVLNQIGFGDVKKREGSFLLMRLRLEKRLQMITTCELSGRNPSETKIHRAMDERRGQKYNFLFFIFIRWLMRKGERTIWLELGESCLVDGQSQISRKRCLMPIRAFCLNQGIDILLSWTCPLLLWEVVIKIY